MKTKVVQVLSVFALVSSLIIGFVLLQKYPAKEKVAGAEIQKQKQIRGIVLPHHELANELINRSLSQLEKKEKFTHLVILAPNHFCQQSPPITTTDKLNNIKVDENFIYQLQEETPGVIIDQQILEKEHGITVFTPYLKQYFYNAEVVPLIFSALASPETVEQLAQFLSSRATEETLFVLSLDFSHQSSPWEGIDKNQETIKAIESFDYPTIFEFKDDHLDSPAATATFLKIMESLKATLWETWENTHGGIIRNNPGLKGTSYVVGVFR